MHRKKYNRIWHKSVYVFNCVCNNDCKIKLDTVGPKHNLELGHASCSNDFQHTWNLINILPNKIGIKNANQLIIGHLNISFLPDLKC